MPARLGSTTGAVCQDIDCFSRAIVGWHIASVKDTATVTTALKMALWRRDHTNRHVEDGLIHHSDAGSQYTSITFAETLVLEGIAASTGSIGDSYDNALADKTRSRHQTRGGSPVSFRMIRVGSAVEGLTLRPVRKDGPATSLSRCLRPHLGRPSSFRSVPRHFCLGGADSPDGLYSTAISSYCIGGFASSTLWY
jgi:transposase InsO family protein